MSKTKYKNNIFEVIAITIGLLVIMYLGINIYKSISPKSYEAEHLNCLEMGSDFARKSCLTTIASKNKRAVSIFNELNAQETNKEKSDLWDSYVENGTITSDIAIQLKALLSESN